MAARRIRLTVRYDGTEFAGSQIQPGVRTVAGTLTSGLETLLGQPVHLLWAGRTDAGVHANGNVASFDAQPVFPTEKLPQMLAKKLPEDLAVITAENVAPEFHPRYDAVQREYSYRVYRQDDVPVDRRRYVWRCAGVWNVVALAQALAGFTGRHAFHNYCVGQLAPEDCICELTGADFREEGLEVVFHFSGNRFLHGMLRRVMAAVLAVAEGKLSAEQVLGALTGPMTFKLKPAPPQGLTLERVTYPGEGKPPGGYTAG
jgi:tRNA pseudouridine38-40 synthase